MTTRQAPRLALLLLERLGPGQEALVGDLAEEYNAGRSAVWYWRQVLGSILIGAGRELWTHKWLGVQAQATFVGLQVFFGYIFNILWFRTTLSARVQEFTNSVWGDPDPLANAPYRWILILTAFPFAIFTGWILAKIHRDQRGGAVISCSLVVMVLYLPRLAFLTSTALREPRFATDAYLQLAGMVLLLVGLLLGAILAGPVTALSFGPQSSRPTPRRAAP